MLVGADGGQGLKFKAALLSHSPPCPVFTHFPQRAGTRAQRAEGRSRLARG